MQPQDNPPIAPDPRAAPEGQAEVFQPPEDAQWSYRPDNRVPDGGASLTPELPVEVAWSASEYVAHDKSAAWYPLLAVCAVFVAVGVYTLTRDWVAVAVVIVVAIIFGAGAARRPRILNYKLDHSGLTIGDKHYTYSMFKSFSIEQGPLQAISLLSTKRFMPPISIYYPEEQAEQIINVLSQYLPFEPHTADPFERIMHRLHF
jgi:hypothetical protein